MTNQYLEKLKAIQDKKEEEEARGKFRKNLAEAKSGKRRARIDISQSNRTSFNPRTIYIPNSEKIGYAFTRMRNAINTGLIGEAFDAFEIYEAVNRAGTPSALNGLLKAYQSALEKSQEQIPAEYTKRLKKILERYGPEAEARARRTIASVTASVIGIIGGIFFLFSNNAQLSPGTSLANSGNLWLGIILLLIGITGAFFYFKFGSVPQFATTKLKR